MIIILDPGHQVFPNVDTGAQGNGLREELLTLDLCQRIKPLLEFNGFDVLMTRNGDYVDGPHSTVLECLQTRVDIANSAKADLFISVHVNAFNGQVSGIETHHAGSPNGGRFAGIMQYYLAQQSEMANRGLKTSSALFVLRNTNMPAILTENGFIDNISDASKLREESFRQRIAIAHAKGVCDYFDQAYKEMPQTVVSTPVVDNKAEAIALFEQSISLQQQALRILKG